MKQPFFDRSDHYDLGEPLEKVGRTQRHAGRERSTGARVVLHRVDLAGLNADHDAIFSDLAQEAQVRDPHVPPLIDAWSSSEELWYVRREFEGEPLTAAAARKRLRAFGRDYLDELTYQTLRGLAALHDHIVSHKYVSARCYVVMESGLVVLRDTGLWRRINERAVKGGAGGFHVSLVANLARRDVAAWAAMIAAFATGREFRLIEDDDGVLTATPEDVKVMNQVVESNVDNEPFARMLVKAFEAFTNHEGGGFESAGEALHSFPRMASA